MRRFHAIGQDYAPASRSDTVPLRGSRTARTARHSTRSHTLAPGPVSQGALGSSGRAWEVPQRPPAASRIANRRPWSWSLLHDLTQRVEHVPNTWHGIRFHLRPWAPLLIIPHQDDRAVFPTGRFPVGAETGCYSPVDRGGGGSPVARGGGGSPVARGGGGSPVARGGGGSPVARGGGGSPVARGGGGSPVAR